MVLALGFLSLVSLLVSTVLSVLATHFRATLPGPPWLLGAGSWIASLIVIAALIGLIFRLVPDAPVPWRCVWRGALSTALLFTAGKWAIGLYLGKTAIASAYGAAGSVVVIIVWVYYSAMIFYFGAELTRYDALPPSGQPTVARSPRTARGQRNSATTMRIKSSTPTAPLG